MSRVVVTGLGITCCLGQGIKNVWPRILAGETSFQEVTLPGFESFKNRIAGQLPAELLAVDLARESLPSHISRHELIGWLATKEALADADWLDVPYPAAEIGVAAGIGAAGMLEAENWVERRHQTGQKHPARSLHSYPASSLADFLAYINDFKGPRFSIATACSSSSTALALAADQIRRGRAQAFVVSGSEGLSRLTYGGFHSLRSIAPDTCRPFDRDRKGIILGEGAATIVLESLESARKRGANIYGEVLGWGLSSDSYHMTAPHPDGEGAVLAMQQALDTSGVLSSEVGYINLHGTGTHHNDLAETQAVKKVFGKHAQSLFLSSTKSMTGHCLGAAGAIESLFSLLALRHGVAPPTANLENQDEACDLNYVPKKSVPVPSLKYVMNNVMAFGGNNVAVLFGALDKAEKI